ncbi:MAG: ABC transporter ATP-binding protein [Hyphomicrobiales bacterium]
MLKIRDLSKTYTSPSGVNTILDGINLELETRQSLALMGESGSGKSTLLHLVGGLDVPDSGSICLGDTDIATLGDSDRADLRQKKIGVIFQQFNLIPSLSVEANISFQARIAGCLDAEWQQHLLTTLGLSGLEKRYPEQLSGGQQQRVAIGRTLAAKPDLILADEPTGNLDEATGDNVLALTLELIKDTKGSLLLVTHSSRLAEQLDAQVKLSNGHIF